MVRMDGLITVIESFEIFTAIMQCFYRVALLSSHSIAALFEVLL